MTGMKWRGCRARARWCRAPDGENGTTGLLADLGRDVAGAFASAHHEYGLALHGLGGLLVLMAVHHLPYTTHTTHTATEQQPSNQLAEKTNKRLFKTGDNEEEGRAPVNWLKGWSLWVERGTWCWPEQHTRMSK